MSKKVSTASLKNLKKNNEDSKTKTIDFQGLGIDITQYLPVKEKMVFIQSLLDSVFSTVDGAKKYNSTVHELLFDCFIVKYYTNINVLEDVFDMCDVLNCTGLIDVVLSNIPESEIEFLERQISKRIEEEHSVAEYENSLAHILNKLVEKQLTQPSTASNSHNPSNVTDINN